MREITIETLWAIQAAIGKRLYGNMLPVFDRSDIIRGNKYVIFIWESQSLINTEEIRKRILRVVKEILAPYPELKAEFIGSIHRTLEISVT
jgi:hypothetical protein